MALYRIIHRDEPILDGRISRTLSAALVMPDGKMSQVDLVRFQAPGHLSDAAGRTGDDIEITVKVIPREPKAQGEG